MNSLLAIGAVGINGTAAPKPANRRDDGRRTLGAAMRRRRRNAPSFG